MYKDDQTEGIFNANRIFNAGIVLLLSILLLSNASSAAVYRWIPSNGVLIANGVATNWGNCGAHPDTIYKITLLTNAGTSGCNNDYHKGTALDPAVDMFFNTAYTVDTNVQGNWYYGRLKTYNEAKTGTFIFRLIYVFPNGTIVILPGSNSMTLNGGTDQDFNISLTSISGIIPASAKLGLRISKQGTNKDMRIYVGDTANIYSGPSGYFSVTESGADTTPPTVAISSPVNGATLNTAAFDVSGTAGDTGSGVQKVEVSVDGDAYALAAGTASWLYSASGLSDGTHTITAKATDNTGNTATTSISITVDTASPTVAISSPVNGATLNTAAFDVSGTSGDTGSGVQKVEVSIDGGAYALASGTTSWLYGVSGLSDGSHTITAKATDNTGNTATTSISITVDTTPPVILTYSVSGYVTDNYGTELGGVLVQDGSKSATTLASGYYSITGIANGTYTFSYSKPGFDTGYLAVTINGADNTSANIKIYDNTPPAQVTGLRNGTPSRTTIDLRWDPTADANYYEVFRDSTSLGYTRNAYWNDNGLTPDTLYEYWVRANDSYNNWGQNSTTISVRTARYGYNYYFAEGYVTADNTFREYITIGNPNSIAANVTVSHMIADGSIIDRYYTINPNTRFTETVSDVLTGANAPLVTSDIPVIVERPMYFYNAWGNITEGHNTIGATNLSNTWYFGEGYVTPNFKPYISVQNRHSTPVNVSIKHVLGDGSMVYNNVTIAATSRYTETVSDYVSGAVSFVITSDLPVVAERPMYFDKAWGTISGGHNSIGAASLSKTWYFAEGYVSPDKTTFREYLTIGNPNDAAANVVVSHMLADGSTIDKQYTINPNTRFTETVGNVLTGANSIKVTSDIPVMAERPMYFYNAWGNITGGHNTIGATDLSAVWYFAEGYINANFKAYVTVQNPNAAPASVSIKHVLGDGSVVYNNVTVGATSRYTETVSNYVSGAVSFVITSDLPVLAERPIYYDKAWGTVSGGQDTIGYSKLE